MYQNQLTMLKKIKIGLISGVTDFTEPEELEEVNVTINGVTLTIAKDQGELVINSAIDSDGSDILADLKPYELIISDAV